MTQIVLSISDRSIVPGLKKVLGRIGGVEKVQVVKAPAEKQTQRQKFLSKFSHSVGQVRDFKAGKVEFGTWEDMMNEL